MKQANTKKVESQSQAQADNADKDDLKIRENNPHGEYSIANDHDKKGYPQPDQKDKMFKNQDEFTGNQQPNKKSGL